MAELTDTGLITRTQAEILAQIEADQLAEISPTLDLSTSSPLGQVNRLFARAVALFEEAIAAQYAGIDPDSATGDALDRIAAITGTVREAATASRVTVVCTLAAGTYAPGALAAAPTGRPEDRFTNAETVTAPGGSTSVIFVAEETGPIQVAANTLAIASPVAGWTAIVSHPDASVGSDAETDAALRDRRRREIEAPGSSSAAGIAADISVNLPLVESVSVIENDTDATVDSIPPHSIEAIVYGPPSPTADDNDAVAAQILASKAAGIGTYGNTTRTILDSQGQSKAVRFTRPTEVTPTVVVAVSVQSTRYAGDSEVVAKIAERAAEALVPGLDVSWSQIAAWCHEVPGVLRVSNVTIGGFSMTDFAVSTRQIAVLSSGNITVNSTGATP